MNKTRYEKLNTPSRVELADQIAVLALDEEERGGKPILYMTMHDISHETGSSTQEVSLALRLSYTAEFAEEYGYSFVPPGCGRSGAIHGYVLEHDKSKAAVEEGRYNLNDNGAKLVDHLRGSASHWEMLRTAHGGNTRIGKQAGEIAGMLTGAVLYVEKTLNGE